jgi:hypothetical protein
LARLVPRCSKLPRVSAKGPLCMRT